MNSSNILSMVTFIYGLAAFCYLFAWVFRKEFPEKIASIAAIIGLAGNTAGFFMRWIESYRLGIGHAPLSNLYESLVFFAAVIIVVYLVVEWRYKYRSLGVFITPLAFLAMAYASMSPNISDRIQPLIPALKSNWLIAHVITCFIGYAAFAVAFGTSLLLILISIAVYSKANQDASPAWTKRFPNVAALDELIYQLVVFGFLFLTVGIITGAVWANSAWGRYWGWDPKETWSLITWLIYAALLHFRLMRGWHGWRIALFSVLGFLAVLFTYFGVNYLPGLHSYGSMS
jgi:cytochrome c-type biogenesis protein CcsB